MPDDGAVDENTRVALRELAQQAEWGGAGRDGAEADARRLRELGRALAARAGIDDEDETTWAQRAVAQLAEHCQAAQARWSVDEVAELARLREAAVIALAPAPGQSDLPSARPRASSAALAGRARLTLPRGRGAVLAAGIVVVVCGVVAGVALTGSGGSGGSSPEAATTTAIPGTPATTPAPDGFPGQTGDTAGSGATPTESGPVTSTGSGLGASATATSTATVTASAPAKTAQITAIEMTATAADGYPEVQIFGTVTASGTGDVTYTVTVAGSSGEPQTSTDDESGQRSYALSKTIYLQPWCGLKSVTVTVASGSVSKSASVPVSGC
jgi:hypothetical protein